MHEWTTSRRSQASNRSGSRSAGRVRQARMNPSWTASRASSRVPEDQSGCRVQPRNGRAGERREGVMIAPLGSCDEIELVHDGSRSRAAVRSR